MPDWKNRIVGEGEQEASQFLANPLNWRTHPQSQRDAMKGSLNEIGWVQRVIVNRRTGYLLDGHERVWEALQNGDALVPYVEVDLSEEEEAYVLATLDPIGAMAGRDNMKVEELLKEVKSQEGGIQALLAQMAEQTASFIDQSMPSPLPEVDMDGAGEEALRLIVVFGNEDEEQDFYDTFGIEKIPNRIVIRWDELKNA